MGASGAATDSRNCPVAGHISFGIEREYEPAEKLIFTVGRLAIADPDECRASATAFS
jgi:hypothetical protein